MAARARGRNIERELWEAWGHPAPLISLVGPYRAPGIEAGAERLTEKDFASEWRALAEAYAKAPLSEKRQVADALDLAAAGRSHLEPAAELPTPLDVVGKVLAMCGGGVSSFGYFPIFPVTDYLLELLRAGQPAKCHRRLE